jgi:hypothetical protein
MAKKRKRHPHHRYTKTERRDAVKRTQSETKKAIYTELEISPATLNNWIAEFKGEDLEVPEGPSKIGTVVDFAKRVRSVLWGIDKAQYDKWISRVAYFEEHGYTQAQAQVRAAKEFPACRPFFREYDIKVFDRDTGSHPDIVFFGDEPRAREIVCLNQEMSYRENLRWAAMAAGQHQRTGQEFYEVPNDTAFYLYQNALSDPKDFMTKLGTMEGREDMEALLEKSTRKMADRAMSEIDKWLSEIEEKVNPDAKKTTRKVEVPVEVDYEELFRGIAPKRQDPEDD